MGLVKQVLHYYIFTRSGVLRGDPAERSYEVFAGSRSNFLGEMGMLARVCVELTTASPARAPIRRFAYYTRSGSTLSLLLFRRQHNAKDLHNNLGGPKCFELVVRYERKHYYYVLVFSPSGYVEIYNMLEMCSSCMRRGQVHPSICGSSMCISCSTAPSRPASYYYYVMPLVFGGQM